jgi:hypothetical protein
MMSRWRDKSWFTLSKAALDFDRVVLIPHGTPVRLFIHADHSVGEALIGGTDRNRIGSRAAKLRLQFVCAAM